MRGLAYFGGAVLAIGLGLAIVIADGGDHELKVAGDAGIEQGQLRGEVNMWSRGEPLTVKIAERFGAANPKVSVSGFGEGKRFGHLCSGEVDLLELSPAIKARDAAACAANGVEYEQIPIGRRYLYVSTESLVQPQVRAFVDYARMNGPRVLDSSAAATVSD